MVSRGPMQPVSAQPDEKQAVPYYVDLDKACDALVRCRHCQRLLTHAFMIGQNKGHCVCGSREVKEIRTLTLWEWLKVRTGWIDFPYRAQFLKEFKF